VIHATILGCEISPNKKNKKREYFITILLFSEINCQISKNKTEKTS
jgi:hypothetical protein